ncbi:MAG TPA: zf-HC2 domain-containing protein, partial [Paraburkholderia sp.]|nr:zf-HC2 domain-containing protein [Paraburkholderia sp.]
MNCDEARPLVDASVDRELSAADEWRMREHLAGCAQCRRAAANVQAISRMTRAAPYHRAPEGLAARIAAALPPVQADYAQDAPGIQHEAQSAAAAPAGARLRGLRRLWPLSGIGAGATGTGR